MRLRSLAPVLVLAMAVCLTTPARSQDGGATAGFARAPGTGDSALEARTTAIASTLRCPVCQGESIQDSPSELAQEMRALVRDQLREGKTSDEIKGYFVARYGEWILLEPTMKGLNVVLYVIPVLLVVGGLALVAVLVRKWSNSGPAAQ